MKTSRRFFLWFGIVIVLVLAVTVALALAGGNQPASLLSETTPEGVVQHYLLAIKAGQYTRAYAYLSPQSEQVKMNPYDNWVRTLQSMHNGGSWKASIVKSEVNDSDATVQVAIDVFRPAGPLSNPVSSNEITFILHNIDGKWLIDSPVDLYWLY